jgi:hypothetical protein
MFSFCLKGEIPTTLNEKGIVFLSLFSFELKFGFGKLKKAVFPQVRWCSWCGLLSLQLEASPSLARDPRTRRRHMRQ